MPRALSAKMGLCQVTLNGGLGTQTSSWFSVTMVRLFPGPRTRSQKCLITNRNARVLMPRALSAKMGLCQVFAPAAVGPAFSWNPDFIVVQRYDGTSFPWPPHKVSKVLDNNETHELDL
jgi:hypothetical protein